MDSLITNIAAYMQTGGYVGYPGQTSFPDVPMDRNYGGNMIGEFYADYYNYFMVYGEMNYGATYPELFKSNPSDIPDFPKLYQNCIVDEYDLLHDTWTAAFKAVKMEDFA